MIFYIILIAIMLILTLGGFSILKKKGKITEGKKNNQFSVAGMECAGVGLLINPFGLLGAIAIVCGSIGLNQAKEDGTDKISGICSIVIGLLETVYFVYNYMQLL